MSWFEKPRYHAVSSVVMRPGGRGKLIKATLSWCMVISSGWRPSLSHGGVSSRAGFPNRFRFGWSGAEFKQLPGSFSGKESIHLTAKSLSVDGPIKRNLAKQRFEMIAGQRPNREEVRFTGIEIRFDFGLGKDNAAFATLAQGDPLCSPRCPFPTAEDVQRDGRQLRLSAVP